METAHPTWPYKAGPGNTKIMNESSLLLRLLRRFCMKKDCDDEIDFFERELNLSHALLDIAGPKQLASLIAKARLGYENVVLWIGAVRDPVKLDRISAKLDRLRERLSRYSPEPSAATSVGVSAIP